MKRKFFVCVLLNSTEFCSHCPQKATNYAFDETGYEYVCQDHKKELSESRNTDTSE